MKQEIKGWTADPPGEIKKNKAEVGITLMLCDDARRESCVKCKFCGWFLLENEGKKSVKLGGVETFKKCRKVEVVINYFDKGKK